MPRLRADIGNVQEYLHRQFVLKSRAEVVYRRNVTVLCELCNLEREQTSTRATDRCNVSIVNLRQLHVRRIGKEVRCVTDRGGRHA